jgi:hypothetical protein
MPEAVAAHYLQDVEFAMKTTQAQIAVLLKDLEADRRPIIAHRGLGRRIKVLDRHIPAVESSESCARPPCRTAFISSASTPR